jgi:PPOX class probable FMN-dependent enzyme
MMTPPWLELFRTATATERPLILSLATVDAEGHPQVRSVVCRRIGSDGSLWVASDARSAKNAQLAADPHAAVVCWIANTREQFRFAGPVEIVSEESPSQDRVDLWREMTAESRAMYFWPVPGAPREGSNEFLTDNDDPIPPRSFEILILRPNEVEHLRLSVRPHDRTRWTLNDEWNLERLNP